MLVPKKSPSSFLISRRIKDKECRSIHNTIPSSSLKLPSNKKATGESKGLFLQWGGQGKLQSATAQHIRRNIVSGGTTKSSLSTPVRGRPTSRSQFFLSAFTYQSYVCSNIAEGSRQTSTPSFKRGKKESNTSVDISNVDRCNWDK